MVVVVQEVIVGLDLKVGVDDLGGETGSSLISESELLAPPRDVKALDDRSSLS